MNAIYPLAWFPYLSVLLVLFRFLGFLLMVPGFSHSTIPMSIKISLSLVLSLALWPLLNSKLPPIPTEMGEMAVLVVRETAVGLLMGFSAAITMEAISLAAQFVGYQFGFGAAGLMDPQHQSSVSVLVPLQSWVALMVLLFTDLHHELLRLFVLSFDITQQFDFQSLGDPNWLKRLITLSSHLFTLSVQMAAPFTFLILAVNAALGILARLLPQMNILLFSFPITILIGLCGIYVVAPEMMVFIENILGNISSDVIHLLKKV